MSVQKPPVVRVQIPSNKYGVGRRSGISQVSEHHVVGDARHVIDKAQGEAIFSTTYTIAMNGTIYQLVDDKNTPYCDNDYRSNGRSVTIEHAGGHASFPYTEEMYQSSIKLHAWLFQTYGNLNCVRHRDIPEIKADPRKATACPGGLDVERIVREAKALLQGGEMPIQDLDNEYGRWRALGHAIRGRELTRDEFRKAAVGQTWLKAIEILQDNPEAAAAQHAQSVGQVAVRDKWDQQIYALQDQVKQLQAGQKVTPDEVEQLAKLADSLAASIRKADD